MNLLSNGHLTNISLLHQKLNLSQQLLQLEFHFSFFHCVDIPSENMWLFTIEIDNNRLPITVTPSSQLRINYNYNKR